jgi:hypothetical protein
MSAASSSAPGALKILFLARSCDITGMIAQFVARSDAYFCQATPRQNVPEGMKPFTLRAAWRLRRALRDGHYDLVISCSNADPVWRPDRSWAVNLFKFARKLLRQRSSLGLYLVPWMLADTKVPLAIYDWEDNTIIARKNWGLLDRATRYFKTQSPRNPYKAFLFQDKRNDCLFNIVRQARYAPLAEKLRPYSVGITVPENWAALQAVEKKTDVFFAGAAHYSWVRLEGMRHLEQMRDEGYAIDLHVTTHGRLPQEEFLRRCAQAWLVWSPEGAGWDCSRHYWAPLMGSVPLLNHPDTRRHQPLIEGTHAFYYGVEGDDIRRVVALALRDKARLRQMAAVGATFVREHHTHAALADYLISETLDAARPKSPRASAFPIDAREKAHAASVSA